MEPFIKLNARRRGSRRGGGGGAWWVLLALITAGLLVWIWWQSARTELPQTREATQRPPVPSPVRTNLTPPKPTPVRTNLVPAAPAPAAPTNAAPRTNDKPTLRSAKTVLEAQIALGSMGISTGPLDGSPGSQTRTAVRAFQAMEHLPVDGDLNEATLQRLYLAEPALSQYAVTQADVARLSQPAGGWLEKSEREALDYETVLELVAERHAASQGLIKALNPGVVWTNVNAGTVLRVPNAPRPATREKAALVRIHLESKTLEAFGANSNLLAHFPCSIAKRVEKRPVGRLTVAKLAANPNYVFDPEIYPESEEAQTIGRKLVIPPGPNNPVGTAWIGLDRPGYGIHGTPKPEQVGRTESHGCFRLANWNAEHLLQLVWVGMPVYVEP